MTPGFWEEDKDRTYLFSLGHTCTCTHLRFVQVLRSEVRHPERSETLSKDRRTEQSNLSHAWDCFVASFDYARQTAAGFAQDAPRNDG